MRRTRIIATVGPASSGERVLAALVAAGVDVFRLNFSHGTHDAHGAAIERIRRLAREAGREIAVLQDLSGPKIRTGSLAGGTPLDLSAGDELEIRIGTGEGRRGSISTSYAPLAQSVKRGDRLLLDDGKIELTVERATPETIATRVVDGGRLGEHKGINAPSVPLPESGVTARDEADLRFGLAAGVDLVGLSFVQSPRDIQRAREIAAAAGRGDVAIVAKLERPEAIGRLAEIVAEADAVMVARGDLGLEMPLEQVPQVQKQTLRLARARGVPVIVATQVLDSMRTEPRPTRAEVSDAAGAVDAGADAIMLSGETAVGEYPVRAVQVLDAIVRHAEGEPPIWAIPAPRSDQADHLDALCDAAVTLAASAPVDAIVAVTHEGRTARLLSARRPRVPIYAMTSTDELARRLCLWWGVRSVVFPHDDTEPEVDAIAAALHRAQALRSPATVVMVGSDPDIASAGRNFLRLSRI